MKFHFSVILFLLLHILSVSTTLASEQCSLSFDVQGDCQNGSGGDGIVTVNISPSGSYEVTLNFETQINVESSATFSKCVEW